jgi:hypothetical protein
VIVTIFPNLRATSRTRWEGPPEQLAALIRRMTATRKDALPLLKLARFGDIRSDAESLRHDPNVIAVTGVEADYDAGDLC